MKSLTDLHDNYQTIEMDLQRVVNRHSIEGICNTPDYVLAKVMMDALVSFATNTVTREAFYRIALDINNADHSV